VTNNACIQASLVGHNLIPIFFTLNRSSKWAFAITLVTYSSNMCTTNNLYFIKIHLPKDNIEIQCVLTFHRILMALCFRNLANLDFSKKTFKVLWIIVVNWLQVCSMCNTMHTQQWRCIFFFQPDDNIGI
jgi:hypothetical protein